MKKLFLFLLILLNLNVLGQGVIDSVSAEVDMTGSNINIRQLLALNIPDLHKNIEIKALEFEGTTISEIFINSGGIVLPYDEIDSKGLKHLKLKLEAEKPAIIIELYYKVDVKDSNFYLPFFFTDLPASASDNDFFKLTIDIPENKSYGIHFPKVEFTEITYNKIKRIKLEIPALPSILRMELFSGKKTLNFIDLVDIGVAIIFFGIALLVWVYRKHLIYG